MEFEWDEAKRRSNYRKHGIDFVRASLILEGEVLQWEDQRQDYGETRCVAVGMLDEHCVVLVYAIRGDAIRLISARRGGRRDRQKYQERHARRDSRDA